MPPSPTCLPVHSALQRLNSKATTWERYVANYRAIVDSVLEADSRKAVAAFNAHMAWAIEGLRKEYLQE
jgi:DNA-binding GntR family transcriptional regulator